LVSRIFLHTNIFIDYIQEGNNVLDAIMEIFQLGEIGKLGLYISESIIATIFTFYKKKR
jgi:predicted nucleic acid-binding protein